MPHTLLHTLDAIVIGAGLSGIAAAAALLKAGARDVLVLEKGASVGGVWRDCDYPGARCDIASALYSYSPASGLSPPGWAWGHTYGSRDEILAYVRAVAAGETVGYGAAFTAERPLRVAIVAAGYADGVLRAAWQSGRAWFGGDFRRLVGRVSMDLLAIDVTGCDEARPGAMVELLGPHVRLDEAAEAAGTVSYEILTRLGERAERVYLGAID